MKDIPLPLGVFAAVLTPQKKDLSVDAIRFVEHCNWLLNNGCDGIAVMGTTGEANSFSVSERIQALDGLIHGGIAPDRLLVGTGCCSIPDTVELTKHALTHNVGGILMLPPFYYKQIEDDGMCRWFGEVINKVSQGQLHICLYHFPKMTGVPFSDSAVDRLIREFPDTIIGMKDSSGDWEHMKRLCERFPEFRMYAGTEKYLLDILEIGGAGCISASANITCRLAGEVYLKWKTEDAVDAQKRLTDLRILLEGYPFVPGLKQIMKELCGTSEWLHMRPPNVPLHEQTAGAIVELISSPEFKEGVRYDV